MYKANNIDTDKFLEALKVKEENASYNHLMNFKIEEARYNQERETLAQIEDMFYCCNYEKHEDESNINITKEQYVDYQNLKDNFQKELYEKIRDVKKLYLTRLLASLKSENLLIYGADKKKKICNVSYDELNSILEYTFDVDLKDLFTEDQIEGNV